jgi:phospholipase D1/2
VGASFDEAYTPENVIPLAASRVALSRTDPHGAPTATENCREICDLYLDAIAGAERLIYIETQYLSSREVGDALVRRMGAPGRPPLNIVIVLNTCRDAEGGDRGGARAGEGDRRSP